MTPRTLTATAVSLVSLPIAVGALVWRSASRQRAFWVDLDPFEIDLQLTDRNDA